jgi:hypothetical protein
MAWPKGVPRKPKESAVSQSQSGEPSSINSPEISHTEDKGPGQEPPPQFLENAPKSRAFNDRTNLEDNYAKFIGLETQGEQTMETADDKTETPPPAEADTGEVPKTSETIEVKADEPVVAIAPTPAQTTTTTPEPPLPGHKYKTIEEAEAGAKEAERKMHEATQERARIETEKKSLEAFNRQMMEVLSAFKASIPGQSPQQVQPKPEEMELTAEQKTELIINNPNEFERIVLEKAKRAIFGELANKQKADQESIQAASKQRAVELFVRVGDQHFNTAHPNMKIFEPFVKEEAEDYLRDNPEEARELIAQKGPQGLIDKAVERTNTRIEQIRASLQAGTTPPPMAQTVTPGVTTEVRTPIPASPVVRPMGIIPSPTPQEPHVPSGAEIVKDYADEKNAWRAKRGLA